ncbi:MAG: gamma-glutamyl-gamma-aminobutyrate hydrolase family protein, partial [Anaerolineae bacterium]|nr:gamma-glutamyl-gamma-aminobutyrate hydrolase family protein [Anaerolineae bacterium]
QSVHPVTLEADSALARILGGVTFAVNSAHHQSIQTPGVGLRVVGRAPDGVIEAVELADYPFCIGVQWHPEALVRSDPAMASLFAALVEAASS